MLSTMEVISKATGQQLLCKPEAPKTLRISRKHTAPRARPTNYLKHPQYKRFEALNDASEKIRVRQALKAMLLKQSINN